mgnify:CR=1 FL=1
MKTLLLVTALLPFSSFAAPVKQEKWTCERQGQVIVSAVLTEKGVESQITEDYLEEVVKLTFKRPNQVNGLTGHIQTVLFGSITSWDSYDFTVTLSRGDLSDFEDSARGTKITHGTALIVSDGMIDCYGPKVETEVLTCTVEVIR